MSRSEIIKEAVKFTIMTLMVGGFAMLMGYLSAV